MNRVQYLLTKLAEECSETAQRASKAIVFGLDDVQNGQEKSNNTRLVEEFAHIVAYMELLDEEKLMYINTTYMRQEVGKKKEELKKWYQFSVDKGMVEGVNKPPTVITVPIEPHFAGDYRVEYDGRYITLLGKDNRYKQFMFREYQEVFYEEMVLVPVVLEMRGSNPSIQKITDKEIFIDLGIY
jgi:hypothetical protein